MNLIRSLVILIILYINKMPLTLGNRSTRGMKTGESKVQGKSALCERDPDSKQKQNKNDHIESARQLLNKFLA